MTAYKITVAETQRVYRDYIVESDKHAALLDRLADSGGFLYDRRDDLDLGRDIAGADMDTVLLLVESQRPDRTTSEATDDPETAVMVNRQFSRTLDEIDSNLLVRREDGFLILYWEDTGREIDSLPIEFEENADEVLERAGLQSVATGRARWKVLL